MATGPNFFYQGNPGEAIGQSLATALFGDPAKAQEQQRTQAEMELRRAQAAEAQAHGTLYDQQARGVAVQNGAARGLPGLFAGMVPRPAAPMVAAAPDGSNLESAFDSSVGPQAQAETPEAAVRRGLPALLAAMGVMQGDKIDPRQMMGTFGAFMGGDELARRGVVAQGNTPGENFALTPQRADAISARDAAEEDRKAFGVARINHASDIPVANIQASASRYGADQRLAGTQYTAFTEAEAKRAGAAAKADRTAGGTPPKMVSVAATNELRGLIKKFADAHHVTVTGATEMSVLAKAISFYQLSGNMQDAVTQATSHLDVNGQRAADRDENGDGPPVHGARKAPDGEWYVQTGSNADGTPAYSVVEAPAAKRWLPWGIGW